MEDLVKNNGKKQWYCRWSSTLGEFESTHQKIWGTIEYDPERHGNEPTVFMGLYSFVDFYALWRHKGYKAILFCGSDIRHFINGYWLEDSEHGIKLNRTPLAQWINKYCENWVENEVEQNELLNVGIDSKVCPSFLGNIEDYEVSYKQSDRPKVYTSVSGNDFKLYGWDKIRGLAKENPDIEFHLYGNTIFYPGSSNIFVHGRVPKEQMNKEIKEMQGALRLVKMDGFSEIIAKSILWGQWPVSLIEYPYMLSVEELGILKDKKEPNIAGREHYIKNLNKYPWCMK